MRLDSLRGYSMAKINGRTAFLRLLAIEGVDHLYRHSVYFGVAPWLICLAFVLAPPLAAQELATDLNESVTKIPAAGVDMVVTTFKPDGDGPFPLVIISHGRAGTAAARAQVRRQRFPDPARYFVQRGFVVVVPTRKGYGDTGGATRKTTAPARTRPTPARSTPRWRALSRRWTGPDRCRTWTAGTSLPSARPWGACPRSRSPHATHRDSSRR